MQRWILPAFLIVAVAAAAALAQSAGNSVTVIVRIPPDAQLLIGGKATAQRGSERRFESPGLEPGYSYSYQLDAIWKENGKERKVTQTVSVKPGQTVVVDFFKEKMTTGAGKAETKVPEKKVEAKPVQKQPETKVDQKKSEVKQPTATSPPKTRTFLFSYSGAVKDLKPGQSAKVWLPVPETTAEQTIALDMIETPGKRQLNEDKQYGNRILFFEANANDQGEVPFKVTYKVTRKEVRTDVKAGAVLKPKENPDQVARFLQPDAKVPVQGKPLDLLKENLKDKQLPPDQFSAAKVLYDVVNTHMKYSKEGKGWGQGDAVWACDSKFGNCTDFHSLFISMARGNKIPSKFEMGFPVPPKRGEGAVGGYHCWAWFMPEGKGWVPVDISEANRFPDMREYYFGNLTEDRVQFTTGRDINLVPPQDGPALNFFIYPYVEVNGAAYPAEKVTRAFAYKDM
jgi:uncharacterized protein (TIGR03000 family)